MAGLFLSGRRSPSGEEMFQRGGSAATGLAQLGMGAGDAVAMLLRNDFPFIEATIATQALIAFAVPINCPAANWAIPPSTISAPGWRITSNPCARTRSGN